MNQQYKKKCVKIYINSMEKIHKKNAGGKKILTLLLLFIFLFKVDFSFAEDFSLQSNQSQKQIKGTVIDGNGELIPGATIVVKGTPGGIISDANGNFSGLTVKESDILVITYAGMIPKEIPVSGRTEFTIPLEPKVSELEEVTIVAFGKQKKESVISSDRKSVV